MNKEDLAVDQPMVVWQGCPVSRRYDGRVAHIARKYVTIEYWISPGVTRELVFDIVTQKERGNTSHYDAAAFRTPEQQAHADRKLAAEDGLRDLGLIQRMGTSRLTLEEAEAIVAVVRGMRAVQEDPGQGTGT